MGAVKRFMQIAQVIGLLVILGGVALAGAVAYLWWDSRRETGATEFDYEHETGDEDSEESSEGVEESGEDVAQEPEETVASETA